MPATRTKRGRPANPEGPTAPVQGELPESYAYRLARLHVETRQHKKTLLAEALDDLFAKYERKGVLVPTAAELASRTLQGEKP